MPAAVFHVCMITKSQTRCHKWTIYSVYVVAENQLPNGYNEKQICTDRINSKNLIVYPIKSICTSGKNHFHEMNGDVGMAGWK